MLRLTPAGIAFLDDAGKLLAQAAGITTRARNTARADASQVTVAFVILISEPRVAGLASTHPLAARPALSICDLDAEPIIRTSNQQDYWTVNPRPSGTTPILGPLTDTVEEMLAVVASGRCMCITAQSLARACTRPGIAWVPVPDISPSSVALAWPAQTPPAHRHAIADQALRAAIAVTLRDPARPARSSRHAIDDPQPAQAPGHNRQATRPARGPVMAT